MLALLAGALRRRSLLAAVTLIFAATAASAAFQYKVGDLDAWGLPPPPLPNLYSSWPINHHFHLGDSLLFLYPPSQDSVVQVSEKAFDACNVADPIAKMADGNSIFNLTAPGNFYFTSGVSGRCWKRQKLRIAVPDANGTFFTSGSAAAGPVGAAIGPALFPLVFGPSPAAGSASSAASTATIEAASLFGASVAAAILFLLAM